MARGRMIDNCISVSEKINDLSLREAFIYTWIIPHLDDWGRITGSSRKLKALVFPMKKEISISYIEKALIKFKEIGLFLWENIDGITVLQQPFEEFNEHQSISESKRAKSKYPEILDTSQETPRNAKKRQENPAQVKLREVKLREDNIIRQIISYLNLKAKKNFRVDSKIAVKNITARLNEKYTLDDFKKVIDIKCSHWLNPQKGETDMSIYLSPDTLFGNKFEKYLNQNANKEATKEAVKREEGWEKIKEKRDDYKWKPKSPKIKKEVDKILKGKIIRKTKGG